MTVSAYFYANRFQSTPNNFANTLHCYIMNLITFRRSAPFIAVTCALLLLRASEAFSYVSSGYSWTPNRTVSMHLSLGAPQPLADGFASFNDSAADALNIWNQSLIHMKFQSIIGSSLAAAFGDGDTSVIFSNTVYGDAFGDRVLAVTLWSPSDNGLLREADVIFNRNESWDSYRGPQRSAYDFHRVALHEFGHVLGLHHPDQDHPEVGYVAPSPPPVAMMRSTISNLDALQADDTNGAHAIYDAGPAYRSSISAPNLLNISTRGFVAPGDNILIGGFIVQGSQPATVVLRGIGHSLTGRGIAHALIDPVIELRNSAGAVLASSDDWCGEEGADSIASYRLDPTNSREAAILQTLNAGSYTVALRSFELESEDLTGVGLIELYDLHTTGGRAGNLSTRGRVSAGDNSLIAGFIIGPGPAKELVIRGLGPSLQDAGVPETLANPLLEVRDAFGTIVRANDNWMTDSEASAVQSSGLAPTRSNEAAIHATLNAGTFTALLRGAVNGTGVALVEIYDLSAAPN